MAHKKHPRPTPLEDSLYAGPPTENKRGRRLTKPEETPQATQTKGGKQAKEDK